MGSSEAKFRRDNRKKFDREVERLEAKKRKKAKATPLPIVRRGRG
jgi:hypothetical protein